MVLAGIGWSRAHTQLASVTHGAKAKESWRPQRRPGQKEQALRDAKGLLDRVS